MRILVTGGAGFIGSHLCERLLRDGHEVVCVDNLITGREKNIEEFKQEKRFTFVNQDIIQKFEVTGQIDQIYNLASPASPVDYAKFNLETLWVNSKGLENMLELAREKNIRIVHTSTSEVYGDPKIHPQEEEYYGHVNPYGPRSCYDESKRFAEALIYVYRRKFKINTGIVRIFNTYGPKMKADDGRVVSNFITQAIAGIDLTIYGDGKQTRSFCYIDDMISGLVKMMNSNEEGPINLGNPEEKEVKELASLVTRLVAGKSKVVYKKLPQDDPKQRCPNITKARKLLGFEPKTGIEEGLKKTINYFKF